ncbi:MAG: 4-(cytidine 5'-diphospho)-2-C-methyl-D-erythritol kinase [Clostridiales bacterium]|nr:4-(cytidine 5'-diphospho)-2-C-methyl-D-erythritol kinase [Clostridiales bacterium]
MDSISVKAFAKVNMHLKVTGKRPDGYHGLETLFRGLGLFDSLVLEKSGGGVSLVCEGESLAGLREQANLAWQAADMLRRAYPGRVGGVALRLIKRIPAGAGLGGGSADGAAVLLGLDKLYSLGLDRETLRAYAARLGSDVPFCLEPLGAIGRGRGEELEPIAAAETELVLWVVLVKPPFAMSTGEVYARWEPLARGDGSAGEAGSAGDAHVGGLQTAAGVSRLAELRRGLRERKPALVWDNMSNDLEAPAFSIEKRLYDYKSLIEEGIAALPSRLKGSGGAGSLAEYGGRLGKALLSGSGSAFAVYFTEEEPARLLAEVLEPGLSRMGRAFITVTRTLTAEDISARFGEAKP